MIDWPLYKECKSTSTQKGLGKTTTTKKKDRKYINFLSIVLATSRNMTSVQGGKILADVRTDSFYSGPLRPGTQHTSTPLTDNQHNMFRWQQLRRVKVSDDLNQRGLS